MVKHHHAAHDKEGQKHRLKVPVSHILKIFFLYLSISAAVAGWIDYSSDAIFNPLWMALIAVVTAVLVTIVHWHTGWRNRIDDIVDGDL